MGVGGFGWLLAREQQHHERSELLGTVLVSAVSSDYPAIVICDSAGQIISANKPARDLFASPLIGKHVHDFCPPDRRPAANQAMAAAMRKAQQTGIVLLGHIDCTGMAGEQTVPLQMIVQVVPGAKQPLAVATFVQADTVQVAPIR